MNSFLPQLLPTVVAGWFLIFMPSFYELTMSTLLYSSKTETLINFRAQQGGDPAEVLTTVDKWLELIYKGCSAAWRDFIRCQLRKP